MVTQGCVRLGVRKARYVTVVLMLWAGGCAEIPNSAIKLSEIQVQNLQKYRASVQSLIDSRRKDAEGLIAARDGEYESLIKRGEDFRKELYRLASHLLSRETISDGEERYQTDLTNQDREMIRNIEQHINNTIEKYKAGISLCEIDVNVVLELKRLNKVDEAVKMLECVPAWLNDSRAKAVEYLKAEQFNAEIRTRLIIVLEGINKRIEKSNPVVDSPGNDLKVLIAKISQVETSLKEIHVRREVFRQQVETILAEYNKKLKSIEDAGEIVVQTEENLHGALCRIKTAEANDVGMSDIMTNIPPLIGVFGETGIIKKENEKLLNDAINSINTSVLKNQEK